MKCYYHPERDNVATCTECGKGLCKACASKWEPTLCADCVREHISAKRAQLNRSVSLGMVIFALGIVAGIVAAIQDKNISALGQCIFAGFLLGGIPSGWSALSKIQPNIFLFLPLIGWIIYFVVKFTLAYFVGVFMFPINLYRFWKGNKEVKEMENHLK